MEYKLPNMPYRPKDSNKGTFGKILNISGSDYMPGAAYLSSTASLKVGGGLTILSSSEKVLRTISNLAPEIVLCPTSKLSEVLNTVDIILIGCGLSLSEDAKALFFNTVNSIDKTTPLIIDADGLNILGEAAEFPERNATILTPHPKEASRLLKCELNDVLNDVENAAKTISQKYNCITVLKTHQTVVVSPDGKFYLNNSGCSALAKAGSGDVLAGMIAGLAAQKMNLFDAAALGVYLHGLAGEIAAKDLSEYGVLATDTLKYIPFAIKNYLTTTLSF